MAPHLVYEEFLSVDLFGGRAVGPMHGDRSATAVGFASDRELDA